MKKFKGFDVVENYPEDGWLKGYFYAREEDNLASEQNCNSAYRDIDYIRHKDMAIYLLNIKYGDKILDVGCADGAMMIYCGLLGGGEVYGYDLNFDAIKKASEYLKKYNIKGEVRCGNAKNMDFPEEYFDKAISSDFFEHINDKDKVEIFREINRVLKHGGFLVIKTPNINWLRLSLFYKRLGAIVKFKNPFKIVIPHTYGEHPEHIGLTSRSKISKLIDDSGFLNYEFKYSRNSKIEKMLSKYISALLMEIPIIRDYLCEDVIVKIYKPIIQTFFK